jgi:hypothetical protein
VKAPDPPPVGEHVTLIGLPEVGSNASTSNEAVAPDELVASTVAPAILMAGGASDLVAAAGARTAARKNVVMSSRSILVRARAP